MTLTAFHFRTRDAVTHNGRPAYVARTHNGMVGINYTDAAGITPRSAYVAPTTLTR